MGSITFIWNFIAGVVFHLWIVSVPTGSLPNVALRGKASQSSTAYNGDAKRAIDGNYNAIFNTGSCTHTATQQNPWWRLDLLDIYRITAIKVTNRYMFPERLDSAEIIIGNSSDNNGNHNPRCAVISHIPSAYRQTFLCGEMEGRYINVYLPGYSKILTLCEVEVYGALVLPPPSVSATVAERNVVVVGKRLCWSDALFYCRDFYWDLLSLRNEEEQMEVEELLGSVSFQLTNHLWLGLRRYIFGDKWFWMSGDPVTYSQWEEDVAPHQSSSPCGSMSNGEPFEWGHRSCEEHLNFICFTGPQGVEQVDFYSTHRGRSLHDETLTSEV